MLKVFIGEILPNKPYLEVLYPNLGEYNKKGGSFNKDVFKGFNDPVLEVVSNVGQADYILLPHNYSTVSKDKSFLQKYSNLSIKENKKLIIFSVGDSSSIINIPNSIILRMSQYKRKKLKNEIIIPAYVEDLLGDKEISLRTKGAIPVVGFCGWADFKNPSQYIKALFKSVFKILIKGSEYKQGIFFRKRAISVISKSNIVKSNFIVRKTYSGHSSTLSVPADVARREYIENILNSDFSLAIKGDGNYSNRFYEILSLGRIPVLIDTDMELPLEDRINYSDFVVKVPHKDISNLPQIISDFYKNISPDKFGEMQKRAREAFIMELDIRKFLATVFRDNSILGRI